MPMIAAILEKHYGMRTSVAISKPIPQTKTNIEGLEALETADLMVMFTRFRALPDDQLARITKYVDAGKPVVGLRTSTHAFLYPEGSPHVALNDGFGRDVFGQKWITHHGNKSSTSVTVNAGTGRAPDPARRDAVSRRARGCTTSCRSTGRRPSCSRATASTRSRRPRRSSTRRISPSPGRASTRARACSSPRSATRPTSRRSRCGVSSSTASSGRSARTCRRAAPTRRPITPYVAPESFDLSKVPKGD